MEFSFRDIALPAEQDNEPGSHGYVMYKVKPLPGFAVGQSISNTAMIYFDFNYPIITNTVVTQVTQLSVDDPGRISVALAPNPASAAFTIVSDSEIAQVSIYSISGQLLIKEFPNSGNVALIRTDGFQTGTYFVKIASAKGQTVKKLVIR